MFKQFQLDLLEIGEILISSIFIYTILIVLSRWVGPRSFSRFTAFDFAVTVALGAIVGSTATGGVPISNGILGLFLLFLLRFAVAHFRRKGLSKLVDNSPLLVMYGSKILPEYLERAQLTEDDLLQTLRKSGITQLTQIQAVIMERDGSISVLKTGEPLDAYLLKGVEGLPPSQQEKVEPPLKENN